MKTRLFVFVVLLSQLLGSCMTTQTNLAESKVRERNFQMQREQQRREAETRRESFRIKVNRAMSNSVANLSMELYKKLGKGKTSPESDFSTSNIDYYYEDGTASVPITVYWQKGKNLVEISGVLHYLGNGSCLFKCTDISKSARYINARYIDKLSKEGGIF